MSPSVKLSAYNTGFDDEADFDAWVAYVAAHIDEEVGFEVEVDSFAFTGRNSGFENEISDATDEEREAILEAVQHSLWDRALADNFDRAESEINFDDEDAVLTEMERELDNNRLVINEDRELTGFGAGTVYRIESGSKEWHIVADSDQERELALKIVKQDLDDQPEIFTQSWLENHINMDRLKRDLHGDVFDAVYEDLGGMSGGELERTARQYDVDPTSDDDADTFECDLEELAEKITEEQLKDPMAYLEDIYGDDAAKQAIQIAGIDIDAAAEDAVDTDGAAHFLSSYDGKSHETKNGLVYWRSN